MTGISSSKGYRIKGENGYAADVDHQNALIVTPPPTSRTPFGEALVENNVPELQIKFPYGIPTDLVNERHNGGSSGVSNGVVSLSTGAAASRTAEILTRDTIDYRPGMGILTRISARFTSGAAGSQQLIGYGDSGAGFFFGYNGTSFGVMRRTGGVPEVRTLTITTKSSTAENITITLNGNATSVPVTNGADATVTANEIAAVSYASNGRGWTAVAVGNTVIFYSWQAGSKTGTYSLSGATTAVGTFAQSLAGASATETWVAQANWSERDKFDGAGATGITLDPTKGNLYAIDYQDGFGEARFYIEDPNDGDLHLVHRITNGNVATSPLIINPSLPLIASAENFANTTDIVLYVNALSAFHQGNSPIRGIRRGATSSKTLASDAETPVITLRNRIVNGSYFNKSRVKLLFVTIAINHNKPVTMKFYRGSVLVGASFVNAATGSLVQVDTSATSAAGGTSLFAVGLGATATQLIDFRGETEIHEGVIDPGETFTITADPLSGAGAEILASIYFTEII